MPLGNNAGVSPSVEKAMESFRQRLAQETVHKAIKVDDGLVEQVRRVVDERDRLFHMASEIIATMLIEANKGVVPAELRQITESAWLPQLEAIGAGREPTPEELKNALAISGIDIVKGYERLLTAIKRQKEKNGGES